MNNFVIDTPDNFWQIRWLDKYMEGHKGFIAGGCFKNILSGEKVKDIDIFFESESDFQETVDLFNDEKHQKDGEYIPSLSQLNLMNHYMDELNKAFAYVSASLLSLDGYWSSTENSQNYAWYVYFSSGGTLSDNKCYNYWVRTVIDF